MVGIMAFAATVENFWDIKMNIFERVLFAVATILLLSQDNIYDWQSHFEVIQDSHIIGLNGFSFL